MNSSLVGGGLA